MSDLHRENIFQTSQALSASRLSIPVSELSDTAQLESFCSLMLPLPEDPETLSDVHQHSPFWTEDHGDLGSGNV